MNEKPNRITFKFNLALFSYLCIGFFVSLMFAPEKEEKVLWDTVFETLPVLSIIVAFFIGLFLLLWGAKLCELFWNKFISNIFNLKGIDFQEALSIVLVLAIVAASLK
jgi:hypothetical protein